MRDRTKIVVATWILLSVYLGHATAYNTSSVPCVPSVPNTDQEFPVPSWLKTPQTTRFVMASLLWAFTLWFFGTMLHYAYVDLFTNNEGGET